MKNKTTATQQGLFTTPKKEIKVDQPHENPASTTIDNGTQNIPSTGTPVQATDTPAQEVAEDSIQSELKQPVTDQQQDQSPKQPQQLLTPFGQALQAAFETLLKIAPVSLAKMEMGFARQLMDNNVKLRQCKPNTIVDAISNVIRFGLTLNPVRSLATLVPMKGECVLFTQYQGLICVLKRDNAVKFIEAYIVYDDEMSTFFYDRDSGQIKHDIYYADTEDEQKKRKPKFVYIKAILTDDTILYPQPIPFWEVERRKRYSKIDDIWNNFPEDMIKKTGIRMNYKLLQKYDMNKVLSDLIEYENKYFGIEESKNKQIEQAKMFAPPLIEE
jgi:recombinational DNA repair protein RecT